MSTLAGIDFFATTVECGSFASAARHLGVTASAVSRRVAQLESELGVSLLARTTRTLRLTDDGRAFHERCVRILEELRDAREAIVRASKKPSGRLRVEAPLSLGRIVLAPKIPEFLARHPEIKLELMVRDRFIDPVAEGIDVIVRIGALGESSLIARRLGEARVLMCASPAYLKKRGTPKTLSDLARHNCLAYLREDGHPYPWRFASAQDEGTRVVDIAGHYHANDAEILHIGAVAGKGIVALFDFSVARSMRRGELVRVLEDHPLQSRPIHALYPKNRHLLPKVRVFLDFLVTLFKK